MSCLTSLILNSEAAKWTMTEPKSSIGQELNQIKPAKVMKRENRREGEKEGRGVLCLSLKIWACPSL